VDPTVPPVDINNVSGADAGAPRAQTIPAGTVIFRVTVQVSPGVKNVVGAVDPFVQLLRVLIFPAILVVHAVAKPFIAKTTIKIVTTDVLVMKELEIKFLSTRGFFLIITTDLGSIVHEDTLIINKERKICNFF
jgi:hypothetical protein